MSVDFKDCVIEDLLPHAGDMVMLHEILSSGKDDCTCRVDVDRITYFREQDGRVPSWVGVEIMAQVAAAHEGLRLREEGGKPKPGFLVSTRKYDCHVPWFLPGQQLKVAVVAEFGQRSGMNVLTCTIRDLNEGFPVASASINVYVPEEEIPLSR